MENVQYTNLKFLYWWTFGDS